MTTISKDFSADGVIQLTEKEFRLISDLVRTRFGINLTDKKKALVRGRLHSQVKSMGFSTFEEYYKTVIEDTTGGNLLSLIDRISTNHSFFFREADHFSFLITAALPEIIQKLEAQKSNDLRIWCAGCAGGEEAYTIAMALTEFFGSDLYRWDVGILATDISVTALEQAREGIYPEGRVEAVPVRYKQYFKKLSEDRYAVADRIKKIVLFKRLNLMREIYPFKGRFHIIFCRNVMIYFDQETKNNLVAKLRRYMHEDGYLLIGHSESLGRKPGMFRYIKPTVYKTC